MEKILNIFQTSLKLKGSGQLEEAKQLLDELENITISKNVLHPLHNIRFKTSCQLIQITESLIRELGEKLNKLSHDRENKELEEKTLETKSDIENVSLNKKLTEDPMTAQLQKLVLLLKDLHKNAKQAVGCARVILPVYAPEMSGLLRAEYSALIQLSQFGQANEEKKHLLQQAADIVKKAKEIYTISRRGGEEEEVEKVSERKQDKKNRKKENREKKKREGNNKDSLV